MSSRSAARGREAARSIRLALRTSSIVAVSSASPSRCFLFWPGRRARIASPIVRATVAIPPTTPPHPLPIRRHAPRRRLERAAQETMGGEHNHPWGIDTEAQVPGYVGCFQHVATALRATMPGVRIEWAVSKAGVWTFSVLDAYPGDSYVDLIGAHYYDVGAQFTTQRAFDKFLNSTRYGGPQGLNSWLPVVTAHGRPVDVPEWGVWMRHAPARDADGPG